MATPIASTFLFISAFDFAFQLQIISTNYKQIRNDDYIDYLAAAAAAAHDDDDDFVLKFHKVNLKRGGSFRKL